MIEFFESYQTEIIYAAVVLLVLGVVNLLGVAVIKRIGKKTGINEARVNLIARYINVSVLFIAVLFLSFIFGARWDDIGVVFSSVFAVVGIAFFAVWSILSNVTSGVIMFFSFPYKVGDKIEIHDKDFPLRGIIEDIGAFQLHLRLENGDLVTYPNNLILQKAVTLVKKDAFDELDR